MEHKQPVRWRLVVTMGLLGSTATAMGQTVVTTSGEEVARVVSSTPVVQQISEMRNVCTNTPVTVAQPKSGAGALLGAIAGGAVGNSVGGGSGRAAATALGIFGGAIMGDKVEGGGASTQYVQNCAVQPVTRQITMYHVVYEFGGRQFSTTLPNDPGPTLAIQISPMGMQSPAEPMPAAAPPAPVYMAPAPYPPTYVYPAPYPYRYAPVPFGINFDFGYYRHSHR